MATKWPSSVSQSVSGALKKQFCRGPVSGLTYRLELPKAPDLYLRSRRSIVQNVSKAWRQTSLGGPHRRFDPPPAAGFSGQGFGRRRGADRGLTWVSLATGSIAALLKFPHLLFVFSTLFCGIARAQSRLEFGHSLFDCLALFFA